MVRDVNLIEHLPLFIQVYREIHLIMSAENPEFQLLADESERIKNNQFIQTCDLEGIARFEKILHISPSSDDTLESRISRVMIRWNDIVPYTWKVFLTKLDTLCGVGNYDVIPNFKEYALKIITHLDMYGQVDELEKLLDYMMPANIVVDSDNELHYDLKNTLFFPSGMCLCKMYELTDSYKATFTFNGNANVASICSGTCEVEITDSFQDSFSVASEMHTGSNVSITNMIQA
ncbi:MAG: DUF2313 domain-containing protein [Clostridia bacterium]|nr:DUF2313 domain-containing protein [Clostridia bacterium]